MNVFFFLFLILPSLFGFIAKDPPKVRAKDLQLLVGRQWTGTLNYVDYSTNKKVSIASDLIVTESSGDTLSWVFEYLYPDEPNANSKETVTISEDGKIIDGETVVERTELAGKVLRIVTEKSGTDNKKRAMFRYTYSVSVRAFSVRKEVQYDETTDFFERNQYFWRRRP